MKLTVVCHRSLSLNNGGVLMEHRFSVPLVKQVTQTECGLCCCLMILKYYKSKESLKSLQEDADVGRDGMNLRRIKEILEKRGLETKVFKIADAMGFKMFKEPVIAFWDNKHYVVVEKYKKGIFSIKDPGDGSITMTTEEFQEHFSGIILTAKLTENFVPVKKSEYNVWKEAISTLKNKKFLILQVMILLILTFTVSLATPVFIQKIVDKAVASSSFNSMKMYIYAAVGFAAGYFAVGILKSLRLATLNVLIGYRLEADTYKHLLKLPYKFFEQRPVGDLLFRLSCTSVVKELIAGQIIAGIIDIATLIVTLGYMLNKSVILSLIALAFFILNVIVTVYIQPKLRKTINDEISEKSHMQSAQVEAIYSIQSIKLSCLEEHTFSIWKKFYDKAVAAFRKKIVISSIQNAINSVITVFAPIFILLCGIGMYFNGILTLGEAIAFESICVSFLSYISQIVSTYLQFVTTDGYLNRIGDIWYSNEEENNATYDGELKEGNISIRNLSFAYNKSAKNVLENINIDIPAGSRVAFVGSSGSGKSTLSMLITGLYSYDEGEILFDGIPLKDYDKEKICGCFGIVPQDAMLFNKSIYDNIVMTGEKIDPERVKECCRYACIDQEIENMPMKYDTMISEMGMNLSGGQRQRILLARALIHDPKVLVLDEATSSLDNENEAKIADYLRSRGCTQIVIAHRLSTIIDADRIYVFSNGKVCEYGTHSELLERKGVYYNLYNRNKPA